MGGHDEFIREACLSSLEQKRGIVATVHVVNYPFVCVDFRNQQRHVPFGIRNGADLGIQPLHLFQHFRSPIRSSRMAAAVADIKRAAETPFPATSAMTI